MNSPRVSDVGMDGVLFYTSGLLFLRRHPDCGIWPLGTLGRWVRASAGGRAASGRRLLRGESLDESVPGGPPRFGLIEGPETNAIAGRLSRAPHKIARRTI